MKGLSLEINIAHEYQVGAVISILIANNRVIFILISIEKGICLAYRENKLNEFLSSILIAFHYDVASDVGKLALIGKLTRNSQPSKETERVEI